VSCAAPIAWDVLVAYWAGDLDAGTESRVEEHAMACAACTAESARVAAITEALRAMLPPVLTRARVEALRARGLRVREQTLAAGVRAEGLFPRDADLVIFRLAGVDLAGAREVSVTLRVVGTEHVLATVPKAAFDEKEGAVLLACQRHFAVLPPVIDADVRVRDAGGNERVATFTIDHRFEGL
jgi:anti-sigma factor RsiW